MRFPVYGGDCYAYGLLAIGFADLVIEADLDVHDFMALVPVIEGAGGIMTDWQGAAADARPRMAASSPPAIRGFTKRAEAAGLDARLNIRHRSRIGGAPSLYCDQKFGNRFRRTSLS